jgi:hypothetical protein
MNENGSSELTIRTAIMLKDDLLGVIGVAVSQQFAQVARFDPRSGEPRTSRWDDEGKAKRGFKNMIRASCENGWDVVYDGPPLVG